LATTRPKISRKDLKRPDEFQSAVETVTSFVETHLREVIIGACAVVVLAAIAVSVYFYEARQARTAAEQFSEALTKLEQHHYPAAEDALRKLAAEDSGRTVGQLANFYLASAYLAQDQPAKARDALRAYLANDGASIFRGAAMNNLAVAYENLGKYKQAEDAYRSAAKIAGPEQARAELGVARMLLEQGKRGDAIAAYKNFLSAHPFASENESVRETLASLGVTAPPATPAPLARIVKPATIVKH
jgi:tetratricopeptide (TPR) repeat protein